ncbi:MAG TPA: DUF342 domain-containing protein [bacterium]|nr:DUF342 domain-containing protein [bacterium]
MSNTKDRDAHSNITVSDDEMQVLADFRPPIGSGNPLLKDQIEDLLAQEGITFGIKWDLIEETILKINAEQERIKSLLIAAGERPVREVAEYIKVEKDLFQERPVPKKDTQAIDHRSVSPWRIIHGKEVIAHLIPGRAGKPGKTVKGTNIPFTKKEVIQFKAGKNTQLEGEEVIALCEGRIAISQDEFWIDEVLELKNGVDYSTGNIDFPGDVILDGEVQDGFTIRSGASVTCNTTLDATEVKTAKDLRVSGGIVGKQDGIVRVGGEIEAKFISHCNIQSRKSLCISDSIYNSTVYTLDKVLLGDKGKIVGGQIHAINGVETHQIGKATSSPTSIFCGTDYIAERKLNLVNLKSAELQETLKKIERDLRRNQTEALKDNREKLVKELTAMDNIKKKLIGLLDKNIDAQIVVHGKIFPGTHVEICRVAMDIKETQTAVSIKLDQENRTLIIDKL